MAAKKCLICSGHFKGRVDAKTCSPRCRKRLQQVRFTLAHNENRRRGRANKFIALILLGLFGLFSIFLSAAPQKAEALTAASNLNFQARLLNAGGAVVPDGNYNIEFKIYKSQSANGSAQGVCVGGATDDCLWIETRTGGNVVPVTNGYFSVNLGSVNAFSNANTTLNWDQQLYMDMRIGGTGAPSWETAEMLNGGNRIQLTSVPLAFRANQLAVAGTNEQILQFASSTFGQTTTINVQDPGATTANICYETSGGAVNHTCAAATGGTGYIQNQTASLQAANFRIQNASGSISSITGASGQSVDIFDVDTNGNANPVFGITSTGNATFRTSSNSANAFQIQNSGGSNIINVDSTGANQNNLITTLTASGTPSFEAGSTTGWTGAGGCTLTSVTAGTASPSGVTPYNGNNMGQCANTATAGAEFKYTTGALTASTVYTFDFYAINSVNGATNATNDLDFGHVENGGAENAAGLSLVQQNIYTSGWTHYSLTFRTGATLAAGDYLYIKQHDATARSVWIDGVTFQTDPNADNNYREGKVAFGGIVNSSLILQNATNSNTAFQVQNSSGAAVLTVGTIDTNLVGNPGAEVNAAGWSGKGNAGVVVLRDTSQQKFGIGSFKITTTANSGDGAKYTFASALPNTTYSVGVSVLNSGSAFGAGKLVAGLSDGAANADNDCTLAPAVGSVPVTTGWTRFTCTVASGSTTATTFYIKQTEAVAHTFWIDGIELDSGNTLTPYGVGSLSLNGVINTPLNLQNQSNSTSALTLQDSAGNTLLSADTLNDILNIGSTGSQALASTVNIANSSGNVAQSVNIGSNANASSGVNIEAGNTGKIQIGNAASAHTVQIAAGSGANDVTIAIGSGTTGANSANVTIGSQTTSTTAQVIVQGANGTIAGTGAAIKIQPNTSGDILIGNTGGSGIITVGSSTSAQTVNVGSGTGASTVSIANTVASATGNTVNINGSATATGLTDTVNIATGNTVGTGAKVVHIADGNPAGTNTVTIGSVTATNNVTTVQGGNGTIAGTGAAIRLQTAAAGDIYVGAAAGTGIIALGQSSAAQTVNIANGTGAPTVNIANASVSGVTISIAGAANTSANSISIANGASGANSTVNILSGAGTAGAGDIHIGNNARVNVIDVGNVANVANRTTTIAGGNTPTAVSDTVNIATGNTVGTGTKVVHIADGNPAGTNTVTIGSVTATNNVTTIQGGVNGANETLQLQVATSGIIGIGTANSTKTVNIGSVGSTAAASTIKIASTSDGTNTQSVTIGTNANVNNVVNIEAGNTGGINIGTSTVAHTISIATGGTNTQAVTIGSINGSSSVTLQGGTTGTTVSLQAGTSGTIAIGTSNANTVNIGQSSGNAVAINSGNANISLTTNGASNPTVLVKSTQASTAAFQIQNASNNQVLTADTSANEIVLGKSATLGGALRFQTAGAGSILINTASTGTGYTLTLPTSGPAVSQCLQSDSVTASQLKFASCASGITLQSAYDASTGSTTPEIVIGLNAGDTTGVDIQNKAGASITGASLFAVRDKAANNTTLGTALFNVSDKGEATHQTTTNSTTAFQVQNSASQNVISIDTVNGTDTSTTNLVNNPSVESAPSAADWVLKGTATVAQDATTAYIGANSVKVTGAATNDGAFAKLNSTLSAGNIINISFYAKSNSAATTATIQAGYSINASAETVLCTNTAVINNNSWTKYTCSLTVSGVPTSSNALFIKTTDATARTINVDGALVQLNAVTNNSVYNEGNISLQGTIASSLVLQNTANSSNAFAVQNASGNTIFNVDTTDTNLISNPGFEVSLAGGAGTGWTAFAGTGTGTISRDTTKSYLGSASLKVNMAGAGTGGAQLNLNPVVTVISQTYTISFFALLGSTAPTFQVTYDSTGGNPLTCSPSGTPVTGGWTRFSCSIAANATAPTTGGFVRIAQTNSAISNWYIDAVQMEQAASASAYGAGAISLNGIIQSPVVFKNNSDSTTALQVQNASGTSLLTADSLNMRVSVGSIGTATGQLYVSGSLPTASAGSATLAGTPYGLYVQGNYAYSVNSSDNLYISDVSVASSPTLVSTTAVAGSTTTQAIFVQGKYAYIADGGGTKLFIYDISNPNAPVQVSTSTTAANLRSLYVQGRYAYLSTQSATQGLQIFDVSNPASPVSVSTFNIGSNGWGIYTQGNYVYEVNGNGALVAINVANPAAPSLSSTSTAQNNNWVYVQGRYAYTLSTDETTLRIYDIKNPASLGGSVGNVAVGSSFTTPQGYPYGIYVQGRYAYTINGNGQIYVTDVSTPTAPTNVGSVATATANLDLFVKGRYVYLTESTNHKLYVYDMGGEYAQQFEAGGAELGTLGVDGDSIFAGDVSIQGGTTIGQSLQVNGNVGITGQLNVSSSLPTSALGTVTTGSAPTQVVVVGKYMYSVQFTANTLATYDISNPASPVQLNTSSTGISGPKSLAVQGKYAYVVNNTGNSMQIFDISNPAVIAPLGSVALGAASNPKGVVVQGRYAFITNQVTGGGSIAAIDVSNPSNPVLTSTLTTTGSCNGPEYPALTNNYLFVACQATSKIAAYNVSNPYLIVAAGSQTTSNKPEMVQISGRYAYVVSSNTGNALQVFDISNPSSIPAATATLSLSASDFPEALYLQGRYAYISATNNNLLRVVDISNPASPILLSNTVATGISPEKLFVSGRYAYVPNSGTTTISAYDLGGAYIQQLEAGGAELGTLTVDNNSLFAGDAQIQGGLTVGQSEQVQGALSVSLAADNNSAFLIGDKKGSTVVNVSAVSTDNLLVNGNFEETGATTNNTSGWLKYTSPTNTETQFLTAATNPQYGTRTLQVTTTTGNTQGLQYPYAFKANTTYTFSVYASLSSNNSGVTTGAAVFGVGAKVNGSDVTCSNNNGSGTAATNTLTLTTTSTWYICSFTTTSVGTADFLYVRKNTDANIRSIHIDGAMLEYGALASSVYSDQGVVLQNLVNNPSFENGNTNGWNTRSETATGTPSSIAVSTDYALFGNDSLKFITGTGNGDIANYITPLQPNTQYSMSFWALRPAGSASAFNIGRSDKTNSEGTAAQATTVITGTTTTWLTDSSSGGAVPSGSTIVYNNGETAALNGNASANTTAASFHSVTVSPTQAYTMYQNYDSPCTTNNSIGTTWTQYTCTFTTGSTTGPTSSIYLRQTDTTSDTVYVDGVTLTQGSTPLAFSTPASNIDVNNYTDNIALNSGNTGDIQPWKQNPVLTTSNSSGIRECVLNGYVYMVDNGASNDYFKTNADGTLTRAGNVPDPDATLNSMKCVVVNGYLYVMGGGTTQTVYSTKPNPLDGSIASWSKLTSLPSILENSLTVTANGYIYVIGGDNGTTAQNFIYYAKSNADGTIGAWTTSSVTLAATNGPGVDTRLTGVAVNGYLYVIGGDDGTTSKTTVAYIGLNKDGSLAGPNWTTGTSLPAIRSGSGAVISNGYIYVVAGSNAASSAAGGTATVFFAKQNSDGSLGAWSTSANAIPAARTNPGVFSSNGYIYAVDGRDTSNIGTSTVFYTSTSRVQIAGGLDLLGLNGQSLTADGDFSLGSQGGFLTAGNTQIVGTLQVQGAASFAQNTSFGNSVSVNGPLYVGSSLPNSASGSAASDNATWALFTSGNYAYTSTNGAVAAKFDIFDISNPATPVQISSNSATGMSNVNDISAQGHYLYAVDAGANKLMTVWDIANPKSPTRVGTLVESNTANAIYIQGRYAYLTESASPSQMEIVDISNPTKPVSVSILAMTSITGSLTVQGNYAYVSNNNNLCIVDISNPANPVIKSTGTTALVYYIYVQGKYAYTLNSGQTQIQIFDISDPTVNQTTGTRIGLLSSGLGSSWAGATPFHTAIYVQGRTAYTVNEQSNFINAVDVSNPASPVVTGQISGGTAPAALSVQGRYLYAIEFNGASSKIDAYDLGGAYAQQFQAGGAKLGTLAVDNDAIFAASVNIQGGVSVGQGLQVAGAVGIYGNTNVTGDVNAGTRYGNRIFSDNFESGNFNLWNSGTSGTITADTTIVHGGKYAAKINEAANFGAAYNDLDGTNSTVYMRMWVYATSIGATLNNYFADVEGITSGVKLYYDTTGKICVWDLTTSASAGCTASVVGTGTWHAVEMRTTSGGSGVGIISLTVDGVQAFSNNAINNGSGNYLSADIGDIDGLATYNISIDDLSVDTASNGNSSSLSVDDSLHVGGTAAFGSSIVVQNAAGNRILSADSGTAAITVSRGNLSVRRGVTSPTATLTTTSGGTLSANTYSYRVAAMTEGGVAQAVDSSPLSIATGASGKNTLTWTAATGATGYKIWRAVGVLPQCNWGSTTVTGGSTATLVDTGSVTFTGSACKSSAGSYASIANINIDDGGAINLDTAGNAYIGKNTVSGALELANWNGSGAIQLTADNFNFQDTSGGVTEFQITSGNGSAIFRPQTDNTSAFQIQNSAATLTLFNVDTTNSQIQIKSGGTGKTPLTIDNSTTGINLLQVKDLSQNFGSAATAGAFISRNSYWGDEFNNGHATNCGGTFVTTAGTSINGYARGDHGNPGTTTTCTVNATNTANVGGGELNASFTSGATVGGSCTVSSQNVANGVERIASVGSATASTSQNCVLNLAATATTSNRIVVPGNLPVVTIKVKPQTLTTASNNDRIQIGLIPQDTSGGLGNNSPANSIYFTNCSTWVNAGTPTGCSDTTWYGVTSGASAATVLTCTGTLSKTQFAYLRIEVRTSSDVHFFADVDTSNGIVETECGAGSSTNITASALTPWMQVMHLTNNTNGINLDIDYFRFWQDDNISPDPQQTTDTAPDGTSTVNTAPLTPDPNQPDPNVPGSFFNFLGATSEDTVINGNLFVHGTIYADKIKANEIEGLSIFTDQLGSLQAQLNAVKAASTSNISGSGSGSSGSAESSEGSAGALTLNIGASGLTVGGDASFQGNVFFYKLVTFVQKTVFNEDVSFNGHITTGGTVPTINLESAAGLSIDPQDGQSHNLAQKNISGNDNSGKISITFGDNATSGEVLNINFNKQFGQAPNIFLTPTNQAAASLKYYVTTTNDGFKINIIDQPTSGTTLNFNYLVIQ